MAPRRPIPAHQLLPPYHSRDPHDRFRSAFGLNSLRKLMAAEEEVDRLIGRVDDANEVARVAAFRIRLRGKKLHRRYEVHRRLKEEVRESMRTFGRALTWRSGGAGRRLLSSKRLVRRLEDLVRKGRKASIQANADLRAAEAELREAERKFRTMNARCPREGSVRVSNWLEAQFALRRNLEPLICRFVDLETRCEIVHNGVRDFGVEVHPGYSYVPGMFGPGYGIVSGMLGN